jgi:hypothetical protein
MLFSGRVKWSDENMEDEAFDRREQNQFLLFI